MIGYDRSGKEVVDNEEEEDAEEDGSGEDDDDDDEVGLEYLQRDLSVSIIINNCNSSLIL